MAEATCHAWDQVELEQMSPLISRKLLYADKLMLAQVFLKRGAIVPAHAHHNQQATYILEGTLRFWLGDAADAPGDVYTDVAAGQVLLIPAHLRHRAEALADTLDLDVFTPPREDWIAKDDAYLRGGR